MSSCPTNHYFFVSQPNVHADDLRGPSGCQSPHLCRALEDDKIQGKLIVAETLGSMTFDDFGDYIRTTCMKKGKHATVQEHQLKTLPTSGGISARKEVLGDNGELFLTVCNGVFMLTIYLPDYELGRLFDKVQADGDYTVVYFSNPHDFKVYEAEFDDPMQIELKRRTVDSQQIQRRKNATDNRPLFAKYQFFTPGIFMAFVALFIVMSIAYIGIAALSSLQVSYGAFEKDMGPTAQKKQQ
jgi:hypothetical protein